MDTNLLQWRLVEEKRNCKHCDIEFTVAMPDLQHISFCRSCLVRDYIINSVLPSVSIKVKKSSIEPIALLYKDGLRCGRRRSSQPKGGWDLNRNNIAEEHIKCAVKCNHCMNKYDLVLTSVGELLRTKTFTCWKCMFKAHLDNVSYIKRVDCPRQSVAPETKVQLANLTYKFTDRVRVSYKCLKCKTDVEKVVDMKWNVSYHKHCLDCYKKTKV
jgi:hypothetical protein